MKKCPTCDKTFDDKLRFCQTDGTPLIETTENQPLDPFKTMVAGSQMSPPEREEEDVSQLPDESDSLKTVAVSHDEMMRQMNENSGGDSSSSEKAASSFGNPATSNQDASGISSDSFDSPFEKPGFNEPGLSSPSFGQMSPPQSNFPDSSTQSSSEANTIIDSNFAPETAPPGFDSATSQDENFTQSPFGNPPSAPIPSPFDMSMSPSYQPPATPPFKESEPMFGGQPDAFNKSVFENPPQNFGNSADSYNAPMQQTEWTPPPAPVSEWQNQNIGQNTPFQPPVGAQGQNQTLAIVSLVLGIISIPCCSFVFLGIGAFITGFLAKKKADENPSEYGGRGLALAGMIIGGITTVIGIIVVVLQIIFGAFSNL